MNRKDAKILQKEIVYDGHFKMLKYQLKHRLFAGSWTEVFEREVYARGDAVCVLLYDPKQDAIVLLEQFRVGATDREFSPWLLEIVAGVFEPDERPEEVAVREVAEETGVKINIDAVRYVCDYLPSPGGTSERVYIYYALVDATAVGGVFGLPSEHEDIKVQVVSRRQAFSWVKRGKIKNGMTIIALQWLQLNHKKLRRECG